MRCRNGEAPSSAFVELLADQCKSVAMRDARLVRDLILNGARHSFDFESYGTERMERMRRLRNLADVVNLGAQLIMK